MTAPLSAFGSSWEWGEIPLAKFAGALFDLHCNDHAGQLAKIRKAVVLPEAK